MPYIGAKSKIDDYLITLTVYGTEDELKVIDEGALRIQLNGALDVVPFEDRNVKSNTAAWAISDSLSSKIFGEWKASYYEVEILRSDGTFYGTVEVNDAEHED